jgi:hypothetical protein
MPCACGRTIQPDPPFVEAVWSATSYATCVYRCSCGRGYSNAAKPAGRTCITDTPERNVPAQVTDGLEDVLRASLNVRNRTAKRAKFCFATSEDAVTWTVFRWLADADALALLPQVWTAQPNATSYEVWRNDKRVATTTKTNYRGTHGRYRVRALNPLGAGPFGSAHQH